MNKATFKGQISKTLVSFGDTQAVKLEILSENGELFTRAYVSLEQFGTLIAGNSKVDCSFETYGNFELINKKKETKKEYIKIESVTSFTDKIRELIKPYEVDGWKANEQDIKSYNYHNHINDKYEVSFIRYV